MSDYTSCHPSSPGKGVGWRTKALSKHADRAVLVAIAIPVFTSQLEKSREATDISNIRSLYAEVVATGLADPAAEHSGTYTTTHQVNGWATTDVDIAGVALDDITSTAGATITVAWVPASGTAAEKVTIDGKDATMNFNVN